MSDFVEMVDFLFDGEWLFFVDDCVEIFVVEKFLYEKGCFVFEFEVMDYDDVWMMKVVGDVCFEKEVFVYV